MSTATDGGVVDTSPLELLQPLQPVNRSSVTTPAIPQIGPRKPQPLYVTPAGLMNRDWVETPPRGKRAERLNYFVATPQGVRTFVAEG